MTDLQCFSFSVGMTPEAQLALIRGERGPIERSSPEAVEPAAEASPASPEPPAPVAAKRRRAKTTAADGREN